MTAASQAAPGALILLYHRVTTLDTDPQLLTVSPKNFADHMAILRELGHPAALSDIVSRAAAGDYGTGHIAVTFDDGYADNLLEAAPILRRFEVPATLFIATAGTANTFEFFWDALDRLLLQPNFLPRHLRLRTADIDYTIDLADAAHFTPAHWQTHRHWNVTIPDAPTPRHQAYRDLCGLLVKLDHPARTEAVLRLHEALDVARASSPCELAGNHASRSLHESPRSPHGQDARATSTLTPRPTHRMLTEAELLSLSHDPLIALGAHTATHSLLSAIPPEAQRHEISTSKSTLESLLRRPVRAFAYPFGCRRDYTSDSVAAAKQSGFACACSNFIGKVTSDTDPHQLPRLLVRDWPADEFRARLTHWLTMPANRSRPTAPPPEIQRIA